MGAPKTPSSSSKVASNKKMRLSKVLRETEIFSGRNTAVESGFNTNGTNTNARQTAVGFAATNNERQPELTTKEAYYSMRSTEAER